jgi:undecaprenyl-diphosphatase
MSNKLWRLAVATALVLALYTLLVALIQKNDPLPLEVQATQALQSLAVHWMLYLMTFVSMFGYSPWGPILSVLSGLALARKVDVWSGLYFVAFAAVQGAANTLLKAAVARPRPAEPLVRVLVPVDGYSFPSAHVMFYTVCFGLLIYLILRHAQHAGWKIASASTLTGLILLVGPSRLYLGAHWLGDVVAGYLLGAILLAWAIASYEAKWRAL